MVAHNYSLSDNGASLVAFSSQYHHESRADKILHRSPTLCWFTSIYEDFPQYIIVDMGKLVNLSRIGIYSHGMNNQNAKEIYFQFVKELPAEEHFNDPSYFGPEVERHQLEHRAGDFIWDLEQPIEARYARLCIVDNYGGSGAFITKMYLFGEEA